MQANINNSIYDRCRCCLAEGKHQHNFGDVHIKMFRKCLNLIVSNAYLLTICFNCTMLINV